MSQPTINHVYTAIDALYHTQKIDGKEAASKWLDQFQQSVYAWEISDQLLRENRDQESQYFAAQTMKTKIQCHFAELPQEQHLSLRDSLIEHLSQYSLASHATLTQLCLALADLSIQCPQWNEPVQDLVKQFSTKIEHFSILLEVLTMLPEEIDNESLRIGANRRNELLQSYFNGSGVVLELMLKCHDICPTDDRTQCKLYQCFGTWLTLGSFPSQVVANSRLLKLAFETLLSDKTSTNLHEAATDCICNALYTSGDTYNQRPLMEACYNFVVTTIPQAFTMAKKENDIDKSINYARIYAEMGDALMETILTQNERPGVLQALDLILSCMEHPNHEVVEISFNFWYRFAENLDTNTALGNRGLFKPYVEKLIMFLCERAQLDENHEGVIDKGDDFQEFRLRVLDVISDVVFVVGSAHCFQQIFESFQTYASQWNKLEARIFAMNPMTKYLESDNPVPGYVLQTLLNLPTNIHVMVRHSAVVLIGDLAKWVSYHEEFIDPVFQYILNGLQNKELAQMSAYALSKFSSECSHQMNKMFPVLIEVSKAVDTLQINNDGVIGILTGCALVLSHMPVDVVTNGLMHLCTPHVQPLYEIVKSESTSDPIKYLDRLACIFRSLRVNSPGNDHPCKKVIEQLWDLFKLVADKFKADDKIMERLFRCIRFGIRCLGQDFIGLMENLLQLIVQLYSEYQHSCLLYVGSILTDEYGSNKAIEPSLLQMLKVGIAVLGHTGRKIVVRVFQTFVTPTFKLLSQENGLRNHPDLVDDFFRLCIRLLQNCSLQFIKNDSLDSIIQLAVAATTLNHRDAHLSVMKFFVELMKCTYVSQDSPEFVEKEERLKLVQMILGKYGQEIVTGLVNACAGKVQVYMIPEIADVLWEMLQFCRELTTVWFKNALSLLPSHNATGIVNATPSQVESFYQTVTEATSVKVLWKEFREFSKYFK